jgi:hypothetical protein
MMAEKIIAYGVAIRFGDRDLLTVPITRTTGYMVSGVSGADDDQVTFGTFHKDLYLRWKAELDRAGRSYVAFEPD